jgi:hypothetical protein
MSDERQKNQRVLAFPEENRSEAPTASREGTESLTAKRPPESAAIGERLIEEACERENCQQALARVKANKGSPGVDGMRAHDLPGDRTFSDHRYGFVRGGRRIRRWRRRSSISPTGS